jgi:hypothetical protein
VARAHYFTDLRKGRMENPGYEEMLAIARDMSFPPALWFEDALGYDSDSAPAEGQGLTGRVGHLFETIRHQGTGESYTDVEVARMSAGVLTEGEVEGMRTGKVADPTAGRVPLSRPSSACPFPTSWTEARGSRSWTRSSWKRRSGSSSG